MKIIISICTFLLLFQISTQFLTTSEETSSDDYEISSSEECSSYSSSSSSSSSSSEERPKKYGHADLKKLDGSQRKQFVQKFLLHLTSISELQAEERLIVCAMREHLPKIFKAKMNHTETWKKLLKMCEKGATLLSRILEQKRNLTKSDKPSEQPKVLRFFEQAWDKLEKKKFHEAMLVFQKISDEIVELGYKLLPSLDQQRKAAFAIDHLIDERTYTINEQSRELREKIEAIPQVNSKNASSTTLAPWLLNAEDIASINKQFQEMMSVIPDAEHPEAIKLRGLLNEEGMSIPYFCKTLAEMQNMVGKFQSCVLKHDDVGTEILKNTLKQPDFKKCWNLFQESALNLMPGDEKMKEKLRKQANTFLFDVSKLLD